MTPTISIISITSAFLLGLLTSFVLRRKCLSHLNSQLTQKEKELASLRKALKFWVKVATKGRG